MLAVADAQTLATTTKLQTDLNDTLGAMSQAEPPFSQAVRYARKSLDHRVLIRGCNLIARMLGLKANIHVILNNYLVPIYIDILPWHAELGMYHPCILRSSPLACTNRVFYSTQRLRT
jgi:hypothetical protein